MSHTIVSGTKMGKIVVTLTLMNWADHISSDRGFFKEEIRSHKVDNALVDTGVTHLYLPADISQKL